MDVGHRVLREFRRRVSARGRRSRESSEQGADEGEGIIAELWHVRFVAAEGCGFKTRERPNERRRAPCDARRVSTLMQSFVRYCFCSGAGCAGEAPVVMPGWAFGRGVTSR